MKPVNVIEKKSNKVKFIILQVLTILLVAVTLVSFSDIRIAPLSSRYKTEIPANNVQGNQNVNVELEKSLEESQKQVSSKQEKIDELESQLKALQSSKKASNSTASDETLKNNMRELQLRLANRENKIRELEETVQTLQNSKNLNTVSPDKTTADKLKTQVQQLETRNALLVKLNNDLKKNNEYLASQLKAAGAGN